MLHHPELNRWNQDHRLCHSLGVHLEPRGRRHRRQNGIQAAWVSQSLPYRLLGRPSAQNALRQAADCKHIRATQCLFKGVVLCALLIPCFNWASRTPQSGESGKWRQGSTTRSHQARGRRPCQDGQVSLRRHHVAVGATDQLLSVTVRHQLHGRHKAAGCAWGSGHRTRGWRSGVTFSVLAVAAESDGAAKAPKPRAPMVVK